MDQSAVERSLVDLNEAQLSFLRTTREIGERKVRIPAGGGKDELLLVDDLRTFYSRVRYGRRLGQGPELKQVRAALDATRYVLLSHVRTRCLHPAQEAPASFGAHSGTRID